MCAERCGVVVLGHGTRYQKGREVIVQTAARYQKQHPAFVVRYGFVEMAEPRLEEALAELVSEGLQKIIVVPLFLSFGHHIAKDLPERIAHFIAAHPDVNLITTEPIGADPLLCDIIEARIQTAQGCFNEIATTCENTDR